MVTDLCVRIKKFAVSLDSRSSTFKVQFCRKKLRHASLILEPNKYQTLKKVTRTKTTIFAILSKA